MDLKVGLATAKRTLPGFAFVLGLAAVAVGAGLVYTPAGLIVGGLLLAGCAWLYARGGGGDKGPEVG